MTNKTTSNIESKNAFLGQLPEQIAILDAGWTQLSANNWDKDELRQLQQQVKQLVTASGQFGLVDLNRNLYLINSHLEEIQDTDHATNRKIVSKCNKLISSLKQEMESIHIDKGIKHLPNQTVFLLFSRNNLAPGLDTALKSNRCDVYSFNRADDVEGEIQRRLPDVIIFDAYFLPQLPLLNRELGIQQEQHKQTVNLICINQKNDLDQRLIALRNGITEYYLTPINIQSLASRVIEISASNREHYRILIVDDDATQADFATRILKKAGMDIQTITQPLKVLETIDTFRPDLILLDLYMPNVDGIELTTIIREHPGFLSTPIVFLSGEQNTNKKLHALSAGGDDFLTKPISPHQLVSTIKNRIKRTRAIKKQLQETNAPETELSAQQNDSTYTSESDKNPILDALEQNDFQVTYEPMLAHEAQESQIYELTLKLNTATEHNLPEEAASLLAIKHQHTVHIDQWSVQCALSTIEDKRLKGEHITLLLAQSAETIKQTSSTDWLLDQLRSRHMSGEGLVFVYPTIELTADLMAAKRQFIKLKKMGIATALSHFSGGTAAMKIVDYLQPTYVLIAEAILSIHNNKAVEIINRLRNSETQIVLPSTANPQHVSSKWISESDIIPGKLTIGTDRPTNG